MVFVGLIALLVAIATYVMTSRLRPAIRISLSLLIFVGIIALVGLVIVLVGDAPPPDHSALLVLGAAISLPVVQWAGLALTIHTLHPPDKLSKGQWLAFFAFTFPFMPAWFILFGYAKPLIERHPILYGLPAYAWGMLGPILIFVQLKRAKLGDLKVG